MKLFTIKDKLSLEDFEKFQKGKLEIQAFSNKEMTISQKIEKEGEKENNQSLIEQIELIPNKN